MQALYKKLILDGSISRVRKLEKQTGISPRTDGIDVKGIYISLARRGIYGWGRGRLEKIFDDIYALYRWSREKLSSKNEAKKVRLYSRDLFEKMYKSGVIDIEVGKEVENELVYLNSPDRSFLSLVWKFIKAYLNV